MRAIIIVSFSLYINFFIIIMSVGSSFNGAADSCNNNYTSVLSIIHTLEKLLAVHAYLILCIRPKCC